MTGFRATKERALRIKNLSIKIDLSGSSIANKLDPKSKYFDPNFPKPRRLGANSIAWLESEIDMWLSQLEPVVPSTFPNRTVHT